MGLDNIQLPGIIVQDLYTNSLVDLNTGQVIPEINPVSTLSFLGNNRKKICIIVNNSEAIYLPDDELNFLLDILTACKLSMDDIALLNLSKNAFTKYKDIALQLGAEKILLFGVEPANLELPLQFPNYQVQHFNNQVYLSSPPLRSLQSNKAEKIQLWTCLKKVFPS
jgi:hypothetical protein